MPPAGRLRCPGCEGTFPVVHGIEIAIAHGGHGGENLRDVSCSVAYSLVRAPKAVENLGLRAQ